MLEPKDLSPEFKSKIKIIDYVHIVCFSALLIFYSVLLFKKFSLNWRDVELIINAAWNNLFFIPLSFNWMEFLLSSIRLLFPISVSSLMILLCFKRNFSKMTPYGYTIIAGSVLFYLVTNVISILVFYESESSRILFDFWFLTTLIQVPIIALPSFLLGFKNKTLIFPYREESLKIWFKILFLPVSIIRTTIDFAEVRKQDQITYHIIMILGFAIASHVCTVLYDVFIIGTLIPLAIFIIIWVAVIAVALWIILKLISLNSSGGDGVKTTSMVRKRIFGPGVIETKDEDGNVISTSEVKERIFGPNIIETKDENGNVISTSEVKERIFAPNVVETKDQDGNVISTTEQKTTFSSEKYYETTHKE